MIHPMVCRHADPMAGGTAAGWHEDNDDTEEGP
jgi:hypothetical protein